MPWRLILFILIFAVVLLFIVFNLTNRCDISFGFTKIENTPVFLTVFASFLLGMLCALPLFWGSRRRGNKEGSQGKNKKEKAGKQDKGPGTLSENSEYNDRKNYGID